MRIIGNIEHPQIKITVFKMDNKLSVKFETGLYEQTYKFRERDGLDSLENIRQLVDGEFLRAVMSHFERMHQARNEALGRYLPEGQGGVFEEII